MSITARAPGKLVVTGEYAVLVGGPALVMAVDRHCVASLQPSLDADCHIRLESDARRLLTFAPAQPSSDALVDLVTTEWPARARRPWTASLDSRALFGARGKLGLGSSAAALVAWAGAWTAAQPDGVPKLADLIRLHRAWQGGAGSGLDVAASRLGGVLSYRLGPGGAADIVSVRLPDSVGFIGVFSGRSASTTDFVGRFHAWRGRKARSASALLEHMQQLAEDAVDAARTNAAREFLVATRGYAEALEQLGEAMGAEIVTAGHRAIAVLARRYGVTYKPSGAGGGDTGLALATDRAALDAFAASLPDETEVLRLGIDAAGLVTEARAD